MIGKRIKELRKEKGMSQAKLANILNISESAIGMYEQGRRTPNIDILVSLSDVFCVSLDYLIRGKQQMKDM